MDIGGCVRVARQARGLTQEELARRADVSLNLINKIERRVVCNPHILTILNIARALDVSVGVLVGEK